MTMFIVLFKRRTSDAVINKYINLFLEKFFYTRKRKDKESYREGENLLVGELRELLDVFAQHFARSS